ncbi:MAG: hypothetical protein KDB27_02210, partial [Planctomycetales bacterium]|nr:hypothetical protein [Planctomycetales bacterium]
RTTERPSAPNSHAFQADPPTPETSLNPNHATSTLLPQIDEQIINLNPASITVLERAYHFEGELIQIEMAYDVIVQ